MFTKYHHLTLFNCGGGYFDRLCVYLRQEKKWDKNLEKKTLKHLILS